MKSSTGVKRMTEKEYSEQVQGMYQSLWRVSYSILRNGADCDDAVQEALFRAWAHIDTLKDNRAFRPWLTRILVNECKDTLRRRAHKQYVPLDAITDPIAKDVDMELHAAIMALPLDLRLPLTLHYAVGYSVKEMAKILSLPETTIYWRLRAARKKLRTDLI